MNSRLHLEMLSALKLPFPESYTKVSALAAQLMTSIYDAQNAGQPMPLHSESEKKTAVFINAWGFLKSRGVPIDLWSDVAREGLALLKEKIETGNFDYVADLKCKAFMERYHERKEKIRLMPEYGHLFEMGR